MAMGMVVEPQLSSLWALCRSKCVLRSPAAMKGVAAGGPLATAGLTALFHSRASRRQLF